MRVKGLFSQRAEHGLINFFYQPNDSLFVKADNLSHFKPLIRIINQLNFRYEKVTSNCTVHNHARSCRGLFFTTTKSYDFSKDTTE